MIQQTSNTSGGQSTHGAASGRSAAICLSRHGTAMAQAILLLIVTEVLDLSLHHKIQHCGLVNPCQSNSISNMLRQLF